MPGGDKTGSHTYVTRKRDIYTYEAERCFSRFQTNGGRKYAQ